jgi:outer membrane protein assembly factor BamB
MRRDLSSRRRPARSLALAVALVVSVPIGAAVVLAAPPAAAATRAFRQVTAKDFEEGEATGSAVLPTGELVPGMITTRLPVDAAFVWCAAIDRDGATAYFGTGDEGKIFAAPIRGPAGTDERAARRLADLDAAWVTALVTRGDGTLLAGTTPGGRIYAVNPKTGAARELATLGADHVWALVRDERAAVTYAGTGSPGKVFAVDDKGKVRQVWDSGDKHVVSLLADSDGTLLAGTSEEAILYRVHPAGGRAQALQDFEAEEVRAIVRAREGLYVAVNDFERTGPAPPAPPGPAPAKGTKIVLSAGGPPASAGSLPRPGQRKSKAAIYLLGADGRIEQVFTLPDGYLTALAAGEDGGVFAGAGTQGRVYRALPDRTASLVIDLPERQALTLVRSGSTFLVGTGDVGGIYRAQPPPAGGGRYLSKVLDAEFPARWGQLRWQGTKVAFETRSGNTAKPDGSWNDWRRLDRPQLAAAGGTGRIASPAARYIQYRATLEGAESRLRAVTTHYLPQNQRARVTELTTADTPGGGAAAAGGGAGAGAQASSAGGARPAHVSALKLRWKVDNPDGDELTYRLAFREQNEAVWRPLASGDPLSKPEYDWNTEGIPDGTYVVRVTVSDERAQPRELALTSSFESPPLLVDNRKPEVLGLAVRHPFLSGRARDDASNITAIELSVDGGDWQVIAPADGIFDDLVEPFTVRLPSLSPGPHAVTVRAADSADNVGAAQLTVRGAP